MWFKIKKKRGGGAAKSRFLIDLLSYTKYMYILT